MTNGALVPPANLDAEQLVLGAILLDGRSCEAVANSLSVDDFHLAHHRRIFTAIRAIYDAGREVDNQTVALWLNEREQLAGVGGITYIVSLNNGLPQIYNLDAYARTVREYAERRRVAAWAYALYHRVTTEPVETAEIREYLALAGLERADADNPLYTIGRFIEAPGGGLEALFGARAERSICDWPWATLQHVSPGIRPGTLIILAGRTGTGKTALAQYIAEYAASSAVRVWFWCLEMDKPSLFQRWLASLSGISVGRIRRAGKGPGEYRDLQAAANSLDQIPLEVSDETGLTLTRLESLIRQRKAADRPQVIVLDYLQLMTVAGRHDTRAGELATLTRGLKRLAMKYGICLLVLSQLNRESPKEKRPPELYDLRESGSIEQDADEVLMLWWPPENEAVDTAHDQAAPRRIKLLVRKNRNGVAGNVEVNLTFSPRQMRFEETGG